MSSHIVCRNSIEHFPASSWRLIFSTSIKRRCSHNTHGPISHNVDRCIAAGGRLGRTKHRDDAISYKCASLDMADQPYPKTWGKTAAASAIVLAIGGILLKYATPDKDSLYKVCLFVCFIEGHAPLTSFDCLRSHSIQSSRNSTMPSRTTSASGTRTSRSCRCSLPTPRANGPRGMWTTRRRPEPPRSSSRPPRRRIMPRPRPLCLGLPHRLLLLLLPPPPPPPLHHSPVHFAFESI